MIRVRFAPSPTGFLHLGSARTALFNWLFARKSGGEYLLRVEDTDRTRSKPEYLDEILGDLKWLGLDWDGEPLFQSKRFDTYREKAEEILNKGLAYKEGEAIIFKVEKGRDIAIDDMVHGEIKVNTDQIKDQVMIKSDGSPAYNFCCVVDDAELGITHIIRGDDHISNTPKQILFYEALGCKPPEFGHMPLMMGADGTKLSKRHGGVSVEEYKKEGFLPEAIVNYLLLLGWSPGEDREIISIAEVKDMFDVKRINAVQSRFDIDKFKWINAEYIKSKDIKQLLPLIKNQLIISGLDPDVLSGDKLEKLVDMYKVRIKTLNEFIELVDAFFTDNYAVDDKGKRKFLDQEGAEDNLDMFASRLEKLDDFSHGRIEEICRTLAEEKNFTAKDIIHPARMAISGKTKGAGLFEMMEVMGKKKVLERLRKAWE